MLTQHTSGSLKWDVGEVRLLLPEDSAGGGLALALCLYLKDKGEPLPKKLVLMSPWTDLAATGDSYETNFEKDPLFGNTTDSMNLQQCILWGK